jgi:glycerol-3-phosphate dehydrogenase (NAD(P)+)
MMAHRRHSSVHLWCARPETAKRLRAERENRAQLPGVPLPQSIAIETDPAVVRGADLVIFAVPTAHLPSVLERFAPFCHDGLSVVSLTKGILFPSFERPSELIARFLKPSRIAVLSGPNHAEEIARGLPASAVVASPDQSFAERCRDVFGTPRFRVYSNRDIVGVELAGAYKNVLGIAAGLGDGLNLGDNAKAALLTRGLVEMTRFGMAFGADPDTFTGLAGIGDLIVTCFSRHGRNRRLGERIALGESLAEATAGPQIAEGANTVKSVRAIAIERSLDLPIAGEVHAVLFEGVPPTVAMHELMNRSLKDERRP